MSLLTEASLVILPNAVEEGKLFSIIPSDGSGDMTAVRATTATLVNSEGVIEDCPYNLSKYSEQIGVGVWTGQNFTMSTEPIGFFPFDTSVTCIKGINPTKGFNQIYNTSIPAIIGTNYTLTGFLKSDDTPYYFFDLASAGSGIRVVYDNINKIIINLPVGVVCEIIDIGSGWISFRITYIATIVNNLGSLKVYCSTSNSSFNTGVPIGTTIYATKIQAVTGTEPKEYFPTTDRLNVPRLDYTNGSCPSILVEPQRTNVLLRSEEFENAVWTKINTTVNANQSLSPRNDLTADNINPNNGANFGIPFSGLFTLGISSYLSSTSAINFPIGTYTFSFFAKTNGLKYLQPRIGSSQNTSGVVITANILNLENKNVYSSDGLSSVKIKDYANGFTRYEITFNITSANNYFLGFWWWKETSGIVNGDVGYQIWGAQLEAGSNATSYIPTVASAVTRNADVISKTGLSGITTITETFEDGSTNVIGGSPTSYTMSEGRIKSVVGI